MSPEDKETLDAAKRAFPDAVWWDGVETALKDIEYTRQFPEDMIEGRTDWDELMGMFDAVAAGFDALFLLLRRICLETGGDMANGEPVTVRTAGEMARALHGVDPSTKLTMRASAYTDPVNRAGRVVMRSRDRVAGTPVELELFQLGEGASTLQISNDMPDDMTVSE